MADGHRATAIRIFGPAIAGALAQFVAVALLTLAFYFLARVGYFSSKWPLPLCGVGTSCHSAAPLVRLSYLLTAAGIALTNNRLIVRTTKWAHHASRAVFPAEPRFSAEAVTFQLTLVVIAAVIEELESPAEVVVSIGRWIGGVWLGAILWSGMWSIMIAATGSLIHAVYLSAWRD